jgi:hypothetical protein
MVIYTFMKSVFSILITSFLVLPFQWSHHNINNNIVLKGYAIPDQARVKQAVRDSSQSIRFINASSLKPLPAVVRDLSAALNESIFQKELLLGKKGFDIYLYDVICNSFENSACVPYLITDTIYHVKLNRFNQQAADKALAVTLIHEIMHCLLLDIYKRAKQNDEKAIASIMSFGLNRNDSSSFFNNDFFFLMNSGAVAQHELIYQLFYPHMVSLLESFAKIHKEVFFDHREAEFLMWSGLQETNAYKKLRDEEKRNILLTILEAKGVSLEQD